MHYVQHLPEVMLEMSRSRGVDLPPSNPVPTSVSTDLHALVEVLLTSPCRSEAVIEPLSSLERTTMECYRGFKYDIL